MSPTTSILAVYHTEIPIPTSDPYAPKPLTLLKYLATTILTTHSLHHMLAQKAARDRAEPEPLFGLSGEDIEGVLRGIGSNDTRGVVVEMEYRRKSGRGVGEWFFLPSPTPSSMKSAVSLKERRTATLPGKDASGIILLEDHALYARPVEEVTPEGVESTFSLGLTEKQRKDREGVVLPYFDAQSGEGSGEGGRILYDMGVEDDFDEEEDEI
jgi:elongator complex protein 5